MKSEKRIWKEQQITNCTFESGLKKTCNTHIVQVEDSSVVLYADVAKGYAIF